MIDKQIFNNIMEEIRKLEKGTLFCFESYLNKYKVTDMQDKFDMTIELIAELDEFIVLAPEDKNAYLGLPWVFGYLVK